MVPSGFICVLFLGANREKDRFIFFALIAACAEPKGTRNSGDDG